MEHNHSSSFKEQTQFMTLLKSLLSPQFKEVLAKAIVKQASRSVVDITELHDALEIAPKSVVAFLMAHLPQMKVGESKEIKTPWDTETILLVNKTAKDVYKGHFTKKGKIEHEFELASIPQLAAHILSHFELYDEYLIDKDQEEQSRRSIKEDIFSEQVDQQTPPQQEPSQTDPSLEQKVALLEQKLNQIILLLAFNDQASLKIDANQLLSKPVLTKSLNKKENLKQLINVLKQLKDHLQKSSGGLAPKMPRPPRPGVHAGSQRGITRAGLHGEKTPHSDLQLKAGRTQTDLSPYLKTGDKLAREYNLPQQPKQPKTKKLTFMLKSETETYHCPTCQQPIFNKGVFNKCLCFAVMSDPIVDKQGNVVTLTFKDDWDFDSKLALWHTKYKLIKNRK